MSKTGDKFMRFIRELRRRKTIRVVIGYAVGAWVILEVASVVLPAFDTPDWVMPGIIIFLAAVGLPAAIILSWIFDITPDGVAKTADLDGLDAETEPEPEPAPQELKPSIAIPLGSAQRRQVTLLRCTFRLVRNDKAVADPEALLSMMPRLNSLVQQVAKRFSAHELTVAGPTCELLFGYPVAFENDALRALAAAFALRKDARNLAAMGSGESIAPILAVSSDLVIIDSSDDDTAAATVVGNSSMSAAWLQTQAAPGEITLSEETFGLLGGSVHCESLGEQENVQTGQSTTVYRALQLSSRKDFIESRSAVAHETYGRESEIALIMNRWDLALDGEDQFVVLRGEPGIGKSTVTGEVAARIQQDDASLVIPLYCSPFESSNAFHPITEYMLGPGLGLSGSDTEAMRAVNIQRLLEISGLDASRLSPLLASLLEIQDEDQPDSGETVRKAVISCLLDLFKSAAKRKRLLLLIEDLHWADPSTLEVISMLVNEGSESGALFLMTTRPSVTFEWETRSDVTLLDLQRLPRRVTRNLVTSILGDKTLPDDVVDSIVRETGGNPLFVEELTRAVYESMGESGAGASKGLVLPGTLQQSLASRIDRLGSAKPLLQLCSLLGRRFDYQLLKAVSETENEQALQDELRTIVNAEFLFQKGAVPDSSYRFKHILMQETAHNSLLKSTRVKLHAHVAKTLEEQFPDMTEHKPELLAYHHGEGAEPDKAVQFWTLAAKRSLESFAIQEAIEQAENGLRELQSLPASQERDAAEITLRSMLGKGLLTLRGYSDPKVEETFTRALQLSESIGHAPQLFQLVVGLWMYFFIGGAAEHGPPLARRLVRIADKESSPEKSLQAHYCYGQSLYRLGEYQESREELEHAMEAENQGGDFSKESASGDDTRIHVRVVLAHVLWHLGHTDRALEVAREGRELAEQLGNPFGQVFANFMSAWLYMFVGNRDACKDVAGRTVEVAEANGFRFWQLVGNYMRGWAAAGSTNADEATAGRQTMEQMLQAYIGAGAAMGETSLALQLAEEFLRAANKERAAYWIDYAKRRVEEIGERFFESDTLRLSALLAKDNGDTDAAEKLLIAAESSAQQSGSVSLAGRAAAELAVLYPARGNNAGQ